VKHLEDKNYKYVQMMTGNGISLEGQEPVLIDDINFAEFSKDRKNIEEVRESPEILEYLDMLE
jgi:hypothetical protein